MQSLQLNPCAKLGRPSRQKKLSCRFQLKHSLLGKTHRKVQANCPRKFMRAQTSNQSAILSPFKNKHAVEIVW